MASGLDRGRSVAEVGSCSVAKRLGSATLHEAAGQVGAFPAAIQSLTPELSMAGRARTVRCPARDNLWIHRAIYMCDAGDVLIVTVEDAYEAGYWGEILSCAARAWGLAGVVIDGCVRDRGRLAHAGLPVFGRGTCIRGTSKNPDGGGGMDAPVHVGDVDVYPGDFIVGDDDGVVALPVDGLEQIIQQGEQREQWEASIITALGNGARTLDLYGFPG